MGYSIAKAAENLTGQPANMGDAFMLVFFVMIFVVLFAKIYRDYRKTHVGGIEMEKKKKGMTGFFVALLIGVFVIAAGSVVFAATQSQGLCYKDASTGWSCGPNPDPAYSAATGTVTWEDVGSQLVLAVDLSGLKPSFGYQFTLNGRNGGDGNAALGNNCPKPNKPAAWYGFATAWECGTWSNSEGFWNFEMNAVTDASGNFKETYYLNLPIGHYGPAGASCSPLPNCNYPIGLIVKENGDVGPWKPVLMDTNGLEWWITGRDEVMQGVQDEISKLWEDDAKKWDAIHSLEDSVSQLRVYVDSRFSEVWTKLYLVQDEIAVLQSRIAAAENAIAALQTYVDTKIAEIWVKLTTVQGEIADIYSKLPTTTTTSTSTSTTTSSTTSTTTTSVLTTTTTIVPVTENCNLKDKKYCSGSLFLVTENWYCKPGFGTDVSCQIGKCLAKNSYSICFKGCLNGACK